MKRKNRKLALYSGITALLTSVATAAIIYGTLKAAYKDIVFDFEDWLE
jgi:hypothetical protein